MRGESVNDRPKQHDSIRNSMAVHAQRGEGVGNVGQQAFVLLKTCAALFGVLLGFLSPAFAQYAPPAPPAPFQGFINEWLRKDDPYMNQLRNQG